MSRCHRAFESPYRRAHRGRRGKSTGRMIRRSPRFRRNGSPDRLDRVRHRTQARKPRNERFEAFPYQNPFCPQRRRNLDEGSEAPRRPRGIERNRGSLRNGRGFGTRYGILSNRHGHVKRRNPRGGKNRARYHGRRKRRMNLNDRRHPFRCGYGRLFHPRNRRKRAENGDARRRRRRSLRRYGNYQRIRSDEIERMGKRRKTRIEAERHENLARRGRRAFPLVYEQLPVFDRFRKNYGGRIVLFHFLMSRKREGPAYGPLHLCPQGVSE